MFYNALKDMNEGHDNSGIDRRMIIDIPTSACIAKLTSQTSYLSYVTTGMWCK